MWVHERTVLMMAAERMEEAVRDAERARALRGLRTQRRSARVRLGCALPRGQEFRLTEGRLRPYLFTYRIRPWIAVSSIPVFSLGAQKPNRCP